MNGRADDEQMSGRSRHVLHPLSPNVAFWRSSRRSSQRSRSKNVCLHILSERPSVDSHLFLPPRPSSTQQDLNRTRSQLAGHKFNPLGPVSRKPTSPTNHLIFPFSLPSLPAAAPFTFSPRFLFFFFFYSHCSFHHLFFSVSPSHFTRGVHRLKRSLKRRRRLGSLSAGETGLITLSSPDAIILSKLNWLPVGAR